MTDVLKGVRVVELSTVITAPLAGMMLADLGAEVIKVEHPQGGDPFRAFRGGQYSPNFVAYNRGKRSIQLDLRTDEGRAILLKLVARADVLLENYRPGIMAKLGLGDDVLEAANARLIHCSITGFGASGPYSARPAYDNVAVALSGIRPGASAIQRPNDPGQCHRDVRLLRDPRGFVRTRAQRPRPSRRRQYAGSRHRLHSRSVRELHARRNQKRPADQGRRLAILRVPLRRRQAHRRPPLLAAEVLRRHGGGARTARSRARRRFATRDLRIKNYGELTRAFGEIVATKPRAHWVNVLEENDVPFAPVNSIEDVLDDPQARHLRSFYQQRHPSEGEITAIHRPVLIDGARNERALPAPVLGEHTDAVLAELGYDQDEIAKLRAAAVI